MLKTDTKQYHIGVCQGEIGEYCILPGDPGRCEQIASFLDDPVRVGMNREYNIYWESDGFSPSLLQPIAKIAWM